MFNEVSESTIQLWSVILSACIKQGEAEKALLCFRQMQAEGKAVDSTTFAAVVKACGSLAEKEEAGIVNGFQKRVVA